MLPFGVAGLELACLKSKIEALYSIMLSIPDPLHPVVVHFPIAFLVAGAVVALVAIFWRRCSLPWIAFAALAAAAIGSVVAVGTGDNEASRVGGISEVAEDLLDEHEEWGEVARNVAIVAALVALAAAGARKVRVAGLGLSVITAILAIAGTYSVIQAGHLGGQLVYRHGVGISRAAKSGGEHLKSPPPGEEAVRDVGNEN